MAAITVPPITLRTTSSPDDRARGVVIGSGSSPAQAVESLTTKGQQLAEELAAQHALDPRDEPAEWLWEVIDVRLIPGHADDRQAAWLATGTLSPRSSTPYPVRDRDLLGR